MSKNLLPFKLTILAMSFHILLQGQPGKYIVRNYNLMDELSLNGSIWSAVQDTNGTMFFGFDDGIVAYDGSFWMKVSQNLGAVRRLYRSNNNQLYYGALSDFGIINHDIKRGYYTQSLQTKLPDSLKNFGDIWSISETNGKIFFQATGKVFVLGNSLVRTYNVNHCYQRGFVADNKYFVNQKGIGLSVFDGGKFVPVVGGDFFADKILSTGLSFNSKELLLCTRTNGVFRFNPGTGEVNRLYIGFPETDDFLKKNSLYYALRLPDGNLVYSTLYGGTIIVNERGLIINRLNRSNGLQDNVHYFLYFTDDLNLWFCTSNGISTWNISSPLMYWDYTSGIDGIVLDIEKYKNKIYVASLTGLYAISTNFDRYPYIRSTAEHLLDNEVWHLTHAHFQTDELLLLGTGRGLYVLQNGTIKKIRESDLVLKVLQLNSYPDIILSVRGDAIDIFRWNGSTLEFLHTIDGLFSGLRSIAEDHRGYIWIGTRTPKLVKIPIPLIINGKVSAHNVQSYNQGLQVTDVISYGNDVVFSNSGGLHTYNEEKDSFEPCFLFGPEIASIHRMFSCLEKDSRNNVWVGGNEIFLYHLDGTYTLEKLNFNQIEEVFSAFVFFHENEQRTWIGGNNGLFLFRKYPQLSYPDNVRTLINRINISKDSLDLHVNSGIWPGRRDRKGTPDYPLRINLAENNSQVTFYFALPYYVNESKTLFSYRLKNYSDTWTNWSSEHFATYSNLSSGDYIFEVRGMNIYKRISKEASIDIHVPAPWYLTYYSIFCYVLLLIGLIYIISVFISKQRLRKHMRIEDVIQKRLQEKKITAIVKTVSKSSEQQAKEQSPEPESTSKKTPELKNRQEIFLEKALDIIENEMSDPVFGVKNFCKTMDMNQAYLYRKVIEVTGMTISGFIRNTRLKKAAQMLLETDLSVSEVAYQIGFSTPSYFTRCFKNEFGKSPRDFVQSQKKPIKA